MSETLKGDQAPEAAWGEPEVREGRGDGEREGAERRRRGPARAMRQRPAAVFGGAALAGFAVGRLAKAGRRQREERR